MPSVRLLLLALGTCLLAACGDVADVMDNLNYYENDNSITTGIPPATSVTSIDGRLTVTRKVIASGDSFEVRWNGGPDSMSLHLNTLDSLVNSRQIASALNIPGANPFAILCARTGTVIDCGTFGSGDITGLTAQNPVYLIVRASAGTAPDMVSSVPVTFP